MKSITTLTLAVLLAGCAHRRFALTTDADRLHRQHRFVADVTCIDAQPRYYSTFRDQFHMLAMSPRIRWTADFHLDRILQGEITNRSFRLIDARNRATPFSVTGFFFQTNRTYRVGFDRIAEGEARGLEILATNTAAKSPTTLESNEPPPAPR